MLLTLLTMSGEIIATIYRLPLLYISMLSLVAYDIHCTASLNK